MVLRCKRGRINKGYFYTDNDEMYELINSSKLKIDDCICLIAFVKRLNKWKVIRRFKF